MKTVAHLLTIVAIALPASAKDSRHDQQNAGHLSDAQIRRLFIRESIAEYPGPCACPYNTARNGSSCGRRSAYSRPGGDEPLCYPRDVTKAMIDQYRLVRVH